MRTVLYCTACSRQREAIQAGWTGRSCLSCLVLKGRRRSTLLIKEEEIGKAAAHLVKPWNAERWEHDAACEMVEPRKESSGWKDASQWAVKVAARGGWRLEGAGAVLAGSTLRRMKWRSCKSFCLSLRLFRHRRRYTMSQISRGNH